MTTPRGITFIGMLFTMAILILAGILVLRIVPVYIEQYEVVSSLAALKTLPNSDFSLDPAANAEMLKKRFLNQLYVNSIETIQANQITITPKGQDKLTIDLTYQVIKPLFANVQLLFNFKAHEEIPVHVE